MKIYCKYDELANITSLKNHPKNRNKHGQDQIERLAELYKYHGIRHPIIVSKLTGCIVAGHGRKLAAIRAGIKEFPVVYQEFESAEKEYAFLQADNAIAAWAELDLENIKLDLETIDIDFNVLGFKNNFLNIESINRGDENSEWVGMPEFEPGEKSIKLIFHFNSEDERQEYCEKNEIKIDRKMNNQWIVNH